MKLTEKVFLSVGLCLVLLGLISQSDCQLIKWEDYLRNVGQKFIRLLEQREITGNGMPLEPFEAPLNQSLYGIDAIGTAKYHSGFIAKIDASGIVSTSYRSQVVEEYSSANCQITFDGLQTVYDVDYEYENHKGRGTLLLWFKQILFEMDIRRNHTTNEITSNVRYYSAGSQNDYVVKVHPNNGYTQLTAREIKRTTSYRDPIINSFKNWTETWKTELQAAVSEYKYPEICYYCP